MAKEFTGIGEIAAGTTPSPEQVDQIYEIISNAPESEQEDLIKELANEYLDLLRYCLATSFVRVLGYKPTEMTALMKTPLPQRVNVQWFPYRQSIQTRQSHRLGC